MQVHFFNFTECQVLPQFHKWKAAQDRRSGLRKGRSPIRPAAKTAHLHPAGANGVSTSGALGLYFIRPKP